MRASIRFLEVSSVVWILMCGNFKKNSLLCRATMADSVHKIGQAQERAVQLRQDDYGQAGVECLNGVARDMEAELMLREQLVNCISMEDDAGDGSGYRVMVDENGEKGESVALLESVRTVWEDSVCLHKEDLSKLKKIMDDWERPI